MTRSGPPEPPSGPWRPLGEPIPKPAAAPAPADKPVPGSDPRYGVVIGPDGRMRTTKEPPCN